MVRTQINPSVIHHMISHRVALLAKYDQNIWKKRINSPLGGREGVPGIRAGYRRMSREVAGRGGHFRQELAGVSIHTQKHEIAWVS